ncbi:MAG: hypothetical protein R2788_23750 [Saprospiraceae bacterium]
MLRNILIFVLSAVLSIGTFYFKSEHLYDLQLVIPVGIYFILAVLYVFQPQVEMTKKLQFAGLALLTWLVLFAVSYNLLFMFIVPIAGGIGAYLIVFLGKKFLDLGIKKPWRVTWAGAVAALLGLAFMILVKNQISIGWRVGLLVAFWQIGVGWKLSKHQLKHPIEPAKEADEM